MDDGRLRTGYSWFSSSWPATDGPQVGQTIVAAAVAVDQNGATMPAQAPQWMSSQGTVAGVDASGRVRAIAPGSTRIVAAIGGVAGERIITVTEPPAIRIAAVQTDGAGSSGSITFGIDVIDDIRLLSRYDVEIDRVVDRAEVVGYHQSGACA